MTMKKIKIINEDKENKNGNIDIENQMKIKELNLLYKFVSENKILEKLSIVNNPISKKHTFLNDVKIDEENCVPVDKDKKGNTIINSFYSLLWKIKNELCKKKGKNVIIDRKVLNFRFDCNNKNNINSETFDFKKNLIT